MNTDPINIERVDISQIDLVVPKKESNSNGRMFYVLHKGAKLRIVLPELSTPFGAGSSEKFPDKYTMCVSFDGVKNDTPRGQRTARALTKLHAINERIAQLVLEKKALVFKDKKPVSDEILNSRYKGFINESTDNPDRMYISLQRKKVMDRDSVKMTEDEKLAVSKNFVSLPGFDFMVDKFGKSVNINTDNIKTVIPWGSVVKPVIEFAYLWVLGSSQDCFPVWTLVHGLLVSSKPIPTFKITMDDNGEDEEMGEELGSQDSERSEDDMDEYEEESPVERVPYVQL